MKSANLRKAALILVSLSALFSLIWILTQNAPDEAVISLFSQLATLVLLVDGRS